MTSARSSSSRTGASSSPRRTSASTPSSSISPSRSARPRCCTRREFFADCKRALKEDGILITQNGLPFLFPDHLRETTRAFASLFDFVAPYLCTQPCYFGGPFALNWASDEDDHLEIGEKKLAKRQEKRGIETRYWTPAVHNAAFALPAYAQSVVDKARSR